MSKPKKCKAHPGYEGKSYAPGIPCEQCQKLYDYHHKAVWSVAKVKKYTKKQVDKMAMDCIDQVMDKHRDEIRKMEDYYNTLVKKHGEEVRRLMDTITARNELIRHQAKFISRSVR